jgi:hypothetical protein
MYVDMYFYVVTRVSFFVCLLCVDTCVGFYGYVLCFFLCACVDEFLSLLSLSHTYTYTHTYTPPPAGAIFLTGSVFSQLLPYFSHVERLAYVPFLYQPVYSSVFRRESERECVYVNE